MKSSSVPPCTLTLPWTGSFPGEAEVVCNEAFWRPELAQPATMAIIASNAAYRDKHIKIFGVMIPPLP
jgi:hypothetical protein